MQADAYAGFNRLYEPGRQPGPILEAACWAHARRKLYDLAAVAKAPIAAEAVRRIDQLFAVERDIAGRSAEARLAARAARSAPILADLEPWLRHQLERLADSDETGQAFQSEAGHLFRDEAGRRSDLKPATSAALPGRW